MTRRQKDPLRFLTSEEQTTLERISRSQSEPASHVARAKALLAVAAGHNYTAAAHTAGRRSGDAVAQLVTRFNQHGVAAIVPGHGVALLLPILSLNATAFSLKRAALLSEKPTALPPGRSGPCAMPFGLLPMGCLKSALGQFVPF